MIAVRQRVEGLLRVVAVELGVGRLGVAAEKRVRYVQKDASVQTVPTWQQHSPMYKTVLWK